MSELGLGLGPLDLSDADTSGFEALDAGRYPAEVFKITMDSVKNADGQGKMPAGTPMIKVQFRLTEEPNVNRRVFSSYTIPPAEYDPEKAKKIRGILVNFLLGIGEDEATVKSNGYEPDFEEFVGRECVVVLSKSEYPAGSGEYQNRVTGVKPAGSETGSSSSGGLL